MGLKRTVGLVIVSAGGAYAVARSKRGSAPKAPKSITPRSSGKKRFLSRVWAPEVKGALLGSIIMRRPIGAAAGAALGHRSRRKGRKKK